MLADRVLLQDVDDAEVVELPRAVLRRTLDRDVERRGRPVVAARLRRRRRGPATVVLVVVEAAQVAARAVDRDRARSSVAARIDADLPPAAFDVAIEGAADDGARELYYLGIIDILQEYTLRKHVETDINILKRGLRKYKECSCVDPDAYRDRFLAFISKALF